MVIYNIVLFLLWFFIWTMLSWPPGIRTLITGVLVSFIVWFMTTDIIIGAVAKKEKGKGRGIFDGLKRSGWFVCYILVFAWECVKANLDVAFRVIHPDLPIRPGNVRVKISLKSDIALTLLANSITLTPGTTTVDIDKDKGLLYVHWICVKDGHRGPYTKLAIVEKFENLLKKVFE